MIADIVLIVIAIMRVIQIYFNITKKIVDYCDKRNSVWSVM